MMKKIFNICIILCTLFFLYNIIVEKAMIYSSINYALILWVKNLIPSLFPFFIISDILINYNFTLYIPKAIKKVCKYLFNITDNMLTILILSIISGFPSNARNTRTLYDKGMISLDEANHILIFSHFSNPLFVLTTVAVFFFNNTKMGWLLLAVHYLSNFLLALLFRNYFSHEDKTVLLKENEINFGNIFINSIKKSIDTILLICGIIVIFMMLAAIINNTFNFNIYNSMWIKGILEITIGIESLSNLNISDIYNVVISSCFLAFGGLSVHMQVISQISGTNIKYRFFLIGRLYQTIIAALLSYLLYYLIY